MEWPDFLLTCWHKEVVGQGVKCRYRRLVFTLGYDSGYTLSWQEPDSGLYQEGSIFRGHLEALAERCHFY